MWLSRTRKEIQFAQKIIWREVLHRNDLHMELRHTCKDVALLKMEHEEKGQSFGTGMEGNRPVPEEISKGIM